MQNWSLVMLLAAGGMLASAPSGANAITVHQRDSAPEYNQFAQTGIESAIKAMATAGPPESIAWDEPIQVTFSNDSDQVVKVFWHDYNGDTVKYKNLQPGASYDQWTFATHPWSATSKTDSSVEIFVDGEDVFTPIGADNGRTISITNAPIIKSTASVDSLLANFINESDVSAELWWHDFYGNLVMYATIAPGGSFSQWTFVTHPWSATSTGVSPEVELSIDDGDYYIPVSYANDHGKNVYIRNVDCPEMCPGASHDIFKSTGYDKPITVQFINKSNEPVTLWWHNYSGAKVSYAVIQPDANLIQQTFATHPWSTSKVSNPCQRVDVDEEEVFIPIADDDGRTLYITDHVVTDPKEVPTVNGAQGTIFLNGNWVPDGVVTVYDSVTSTGACSTWMFDRRSGWAWTDTWCFETQFTDETKTIVISVNQEFSEAEAEDKAEFFAEAIGRLPKLLRRDVLTVWIHDGLEGFGGGNNNLLIHTDQSDQYIDNWNDILDETFIHEAAHTSLDAYLYGTMEWNFAVAADGKYISDYAREFNNREDIAETFLVWFATRYRAETFTAEELAQWEDDMGHRFAVFDNLCEEMSPYADIC